MSVCRKVHMYTSMIAFLTGFHLNLARASSLQVSFGVSPPLVPLVRACNYTHTLTRDVAISWCAKMFDLEAAFSGL